MIERLKKLSLIQRILIGMVIGILLGILVPNWKFVGILGDLFVTALKSIAPLLVFVLIMATIAKHRSGSKTNIRSIVVLYLLGTFLSAVAAVIASYLFPLTIKLTDSAEGMAPPESMSAVLQNVLVNVVQNPVNALIEGNYLALLFWATLLGLSLRSLAKSTVAVIDDFSKAVTAVVQMVIKCAPLGILGLVFNAISADGLGGLAQYAKLLVLLVGTMAVVALVIYPFIVFLYIRKNPYPLVFFCLKESGIPAFFMRSSAANIPVNMRLAKQMDLDEASYSISIPLGATINMGGAAVTISIMTLAAVHTQNIQISLPVALFLCVLSALAACGASGIAGGSLLLIPLACSIFGIPNDIAMQVVGVGFVIGVIQDSVETAINSSSDLLFTATADIAAKRKAAKQKPVETISD